MLYASHVSTAVFLVGLLLEDFIATLGLVRLSGYLDLIPLSLL